MNKFMQSASTVVKFGYDALLNKGRRRSPTAKKKAESDILTQQKRESLGATIWDIVRNDSTASWAYNKYLDYCTGFYFQSKTRNAEFDRAIENAMWEWSKKENCDVAGRNSFSSMIRLFGAGITNDGDAAFLKIKGGKLQGIESDRIATPFDIKKDENIKDGLYLDAYGKASKYVICKRDSSGNKIIDKEIAAKDVVFAGNFIRFDQIRGVPFFAPVVNTFQDLKEIDEYQLIKCKKHAAFGIMLKRGDSGASGFNEAAEATTDTGGTAVSQYLYNIGAGMKIEGGKDDSADMFESKNPSTEYREYSELMLRKAFSSFFIPYSFFDSRQSSYSAQKQDRAEFTRAIKRMRELILSALTEITEWVIPFLINTYNINVPAGIDVQNWEWIPEAEPWLNEKDEVEASGLRIAFGLSSRQLECKKHGLDFFDVARDLDSEEKYIKKAGISISTGTPGMGVSNVSQKEDKINGN